MSLVLAPIHYMMQDKVKEVETLTEQVCELLKAQGICEDLENDLNAKYGEIARGELKEIIDQTNIHGWLQEQVDIAETRLAQAVSFGIKENPNFKKDILNLSYNVGEEKGKEFVEEKSQMNCLSIYNAASSYLLDGMPCDGGVRVINQEENQVEWQISPMVHASYWQDAKVGLDMFYQIRDAWYQGFFEKFDVEYKRNSVDTFQILLK